VGTARGLVGSDLGIGRFTVFDPDGELLATYRPADMPIVPPFDLTFAGPDTLRFRRNLS
jgi:hypothetical protein